MSKGPIRRGQLIAPFGVGALVIVKDGTSAIAAGLDHWYVPEGGATAGHDIDVEEYKVEEWRLQRLLSVDHFRLPPDFRRRQRGVAIPNTGLTVPFLRFPTWHFCPFCKSLKQLPLSAKGTEPCHFCQADGKRNYLVQVPFVAICEHGHIQDFPWREWVHRSVEPQCDRRMKLIATGGSSLADQKVACDCGANRSLANITQASSDGRTALTDALDKSGILYRCRGERPWLGDDAAAGCTQALRGSLRSASNVYYARVYSAIYLPRASQGAPEELVRLFRVPPLSTLIVLLKSIGKEIDVGMLRQQQRDLLKPYTDGDIAKALAEATGSAREEPQEPRLELDEAPETAFRRAEYEVLRAAQSQHELMSSDIPISEYPRLDGFLSGIGLIYKLRETRVFSGFTRIFPDDGLTPEHHKNALWRVAPALPDSWLPANVVFGEGIFLKLNEDRLRQWESRDEIVALVATMKNRYLAAQQQRRLRRVDIEPRFVMMHTLAHLLMNRLTFECGYGSASLRERLYVSSNASAPMAGLLIYTAAGDSEGTMGGLVRMGKPGYLEPVIEKAIRDAEWCSTDPVCMEIGLSQGQGPDACNGAACHNCALVPETSCEHFNRFLDRSVVVGTRAHRDMGFFSGLL
jgi:hypothetical protein